MKRWMREGTQVMELRAGRSSLGNAEPTPIQGPSLETEKRLGSGTEPSSFGRKSPITHFGLLLSVV